MVLFIDWKRVIEKLPLNTGFAQSFFKKEIRSWKIVAFLVLCIFFLGACAETLGKRKPVSKGPGRRTVPHKASPTPKGYAPDGYVEEVPPMPAKGYFLKKLANSVYFFSTGVYNTLFVATKDGVLLVDPIGGRGRSLQKAIREVSQLPVKFIIYSHGHHDHIGDANLFSREAQIIAQLETRKFLEGYKGSKQPLPNISFGTSYSINFGGINVELSYPGEGHGKGNIIIHLPDQKILMYVDVATPKAVPSKNSFTIDIENQMKGIEAALKLSFTTYVAGHSYRPGKRKEMKEVLRYYKESKRASAQALKTVTLKSVINKTPTRDVERLFGEYGESVTEECYRILKGRWKYKLMGFEAFARGHCRVWTAYHKAHR